MGVQDDLEQLRSTLVDNLRIELRPEQGREPRNAADERDLTRASRDAARRAASTERRVGMT